MTLGWSQVKNIICIACAQKIEDHSFKDLGRCLFRVQGTYVHEEFKRKKAEEREKSKEAVSEQSNEPKSS